MNRLRLSECPCGSGMAFPECCGRYLEEGYAAPTAEALMRSRYSAYVLRDAAYLHNTWHPRTRPGVLDATGPDWCGLTILGTRRGGLEDTVGQVTFVARYVLDGSPGELVERSRFKREGGRWFYVDGEHVAVKTGRNDPCPCGSGRKAKRCCGVQDRKP